MDTAEFELYVKVWTELSLNEMYKEWTGLSLNDI